MSNPFEAWEFQCLSSDIPSRSMCTLNQVFIKEEVKNYIEALNFENSSLKDKYSKMKNQYESQLEESKNELEMAFKQVEK